MLTTWRGYTITQAFGVKNPDYRLGYHPGTDFRFVLGTHQPAFAAGIARYYPDKGDAYGNTGTITLPNGDVIFYAHLKPNGILVTTGTRVEEMQPVFVTGNSGWVKLVHAHIEYRIGGNKDKPVDITKKLAKEEENMSPTKEDVIQLTTKWVRDAGPSNGEVARFTKGSWRVFTAWLLENHRPPEVKVLPPGRYDVK